MKVKHITILLLILLAGFAGWQLIKERLSPAGSDAARPMRIINYFPQQFGWEQMWLQWPLAKPVMDKDLELIQQAGFTSVRIFLPPRVFGYPQPDPTYTAYLEEALALIQAHQLKAYLNLFDCWGGWQDIEGSQTWLKAIVEPYRDDPRIIAWELRNEVPIDKPEVQAWVQAMFPYLKQYTGQTLATISLNNVEWLDDLRKATSASPLDFYSLHWYPSDSTWTYRFANVLDRARELIGDQRLLIGEFGSSTATISEDRQAYLYRDVLSVARQHGIEDVGVWTLHDFTAGTIGCGGGILSDEHRYYGIHRLDGAPKLAVAVLRSTFVDQKDLGPSPIEVLNSSFENLHPNSGLLSDWKSWDDINSGRQTFFPDCNITHSGRCSARFLEPVGLAVGMNTDPGIRAELGLYYTVHGFVKTENLDGWVRLTLDWFDTKGTWMGKTVRSEAYIDSEAADWTLLSIENATPPPGALYARISAMMLSQQSSTAVWFDDITVSTSRSQK